MDIKIHSVVCDVTIHPYPYINVGLTKEPFKLTLQWRHNGRDGVSNHQPHDCLLIR